MVLRVVRLGTPRKPGEGLRIGTVRRPPRGVPKSRYALLDYYDAWLPALAPSAGLMRWLKEQPLPWSEKTWQAFARRYRSEMAEPDAMHLLRLLAALSRHTDLSVGCYCEQESRCHRSLLRELLRKDGAQLDEP
jgi:uncharacterized protein YeaO (DUF488 family)